MILLIESSSTFPYDDSTLFLCVSVTISINITVYWVFSSNVLIFLDIFFGLQLGTSQIVSVKDLVQYYVVQCICHISVWVHATCPARFHADSKFKRSRPDRRRCSLPCTSSLLVDVFTKQINGEKACAWMSEVLLLTPPWRRVSLCFTEQFWILRDEV